MTIKSFNSLPLSLKATLLFHNGKFMTKMNLGDNYTLELYRLPDFYAEITRYDKTDKITAILAFKNEQKLLPFIDQIDINQLL